MIEKLESDYSDLTLWVRQCDVANLEAVKQLFNEISTNLPPLKGVHHLAGVREDAALLNQTKEKFQSVFRPKALGAWNLHLLTQPQQQQQQPHTPLVELDFFILHSSVASLFGSPGQANYVAANSFLDALAHHRRSLGLCTLSVNWGAWSDVGMASDAKTTKFITEQLGLGTITSQTALHALELIMDAAVHGVLSNVGIHGDFYWKKMDTKSAFSKRLARLMGITLSSSTSSSSLSPASKRVGGTTATTAAATTTAHKSLPATPSPSSTSSTSPATPNALVHLVLQTVVEILGGARVGLQQPLMEAGMDSLMALGM